jgi:hypothetical protein
MSNRETTQEAEAKALQQMRVELRGHLDVIETAHNLIGKILSLPDRPLDQTPHALIVATNLLIRLTNDLRSIAMLAERGFPLQALVIGSGTYETAFTIAYIDADEDLARAWGMHDDPTHPFRDAWTLTREGQAKLGNPDPDTAAELDYRAYRQLCWAKHINPVLQMQHGFQIVERSVVAQNGPDVSEPGIRAAWWVLDRAVRLAYLALASFVNGHIPEEQRGSIVQEVELLAERRQELAKRAISKWGKEDPFSGKW